jgi:Flp pilus assembly protein CpaB
MRLTISTMAFVPPELLAPGQAVWIILRLTRKRVRVRAVILANETDAGDVLVSYADLDRGTREWLHQDRAGYDDWPDFVFMAVEGQEMALDSLSCPGQACGQAGAPIALPCQA